MHMDEELRDIMGISRQKMEERYAYGYHLFEQEEYDEAAQLFTHLAMLDPKGAHYWEAAATAHIRNGDLDLAITMLAVSSLIEPNNPRPYLYSGHCLAKLGEIEDAKESFELAIEAAKKDYLYRSIEDEAYEAIKELEV